MYNIDDYVKINSSNIFGKITDIKKDKICIISNEKKIYTSINNVKPMNIPKNDSSLPTSHVTLSLNQDDFSSEIMLRHLKYDEAMDLLDKFIFSAIKNKARIVKVIHGKNGGVLRKAVHEYLKNCKYVEDFRLGYPHEGSYGVTIVTLK